MHGRCLSLPLAFLAQLDVTFFLGETGQISESKRGSEIRAEIISSSTEPLKSFLSHLSGILPGSFYACNRDDPRNQCNNLRHGLSLPVVFLYMGPAGESIMCVI